MAIKEKAWMGTFSRRGESFFYVVITATSILNLSTTSHAACIEAQEG
jgi:hypothetical protein